MVEKLVSDQTAPQPGRGTQNWAASVSDPGLEVFLTPLSRKSWRPGVLKLGNTQPEVTVQLMLRSSIFELFTSLPTLGSQGSNPNPRQHQPNEKKPQGQTAKVIPAQRKAFSGLPSKA